MASEKQISDQDVTATSPGVDIVAALWAGRKLIVAGTLVCIVVSVLVALALPLTFESTATLLLLPSPFKETEDPEDNMSDLVPKVLTVQDYQILLRSDEVLMRTVERLREEGGWTDEERAAAQAAGFTPWRLGPHVLRIETAALAAVAILRRPV